MSERYRAEFDAVVTFANGGGLRAEGFRVDVPGPRVSEAEVAALFIASLGLLMTECVEVDGLTVFPEAHKGTSGGPATRRPAPPTAPGGWSSSAT